MHPITTIPAPRQPAMALDAVHADDKASLRADHDGDHDAQWSGHQHTPAAGHRRCHNSALRRFLAPALVILLSLSSILSVLYLFGFGDALGLGDTLGSDLFEGGLWVFRRAAGDEDTGSSGSSESDFTKNKLYIIIIVVGLFVVLILGIMLSAWCCRGSFENPLCCPCYLCACCGGLACLECIGCGLCCEGLDTLAE